MKRLRHGAPEGATAAPSSTPVLRAAARVRTGVHLSSVQRWARLGSAAALLAGSGVCGVAAQPLPPPMATPALSAPSTPSAPSGASATRTPANTPETSHAASLPGAATGPGTPAAPGPHGAAGTGAGYHSPNSPIAPLPQRSDVLPWSVLTDLQRKTTATAVVPVFNARQKALDKTVQRIQGFMVPLDAKATQTHFLLTSVPLTCAFCIPGGPESMVEVKAKTPVRHSLEPVVVQGRLTLLYNDEYGLFYRLVDAVPAR